MSVKPRPKPKPKRPRGRQPSDDSEEIWQAHNNLFIGALGDPRHAAGVLRSMLRPEVAAQIRWDTLRRVDTTLVDARLARRHGDLIFQAMLGDQPILIYVLLEHQSDPDDLIPLRLLGYMVRLWERHVASEGLGQGLPPILPLVLHHGRRGWRCPESFEALLPESVRELPELMRLLPTFDIGVLDLRGAREEELMLLRATSLARLTLLALKHAPRTRDLLPIIARWQALLADLDGHPYAERGIQMIFRYIFSVSNVAVDPVVEVLHSALSSKGRKTVITTAQKLRQEGRQEGLREGLEEGGQLALSRALMELLTERFGPLDETTAQRVEGATTAELGAWLRGVLTADSVESCLAQGGGVRTRSTPARRRRRPAR